MDDDNIISSLETMILMALDANMGEAPAQGVIGRSKKRDGSQSFRKVDAGVMLQFPNMTPVSAYTTEFGDSGEERLYTTDPDFLGAHPADIFGDEAEVSVLGDDFLRWVGMRRLRKPPRGLIYFGRPSHFYEYHYREVTLGGKQQYVKRVIPFSSTGKPLLARMSGALICNPGVEGDYAVLMASIIEDSCRADTMLAEFCDTAGIKFPVPLDSYKALFIIRDAPLTPAGRKKAILHWVAKHLRTSPKGKEAKVKAHTRGVDTFDLAGIKVTLTPNVRRMAA